VRRSHRALLTCRRSGVSDLPRVATTLIRPDIVIAWVRRTMVVHAPPDPPGRRHPAASLGVATPGPRPAGALLVLAPAQRRHLRRAGRRVRGTNTAKRYVREAVDLLAALADEPQTAPWSARRGWTQPVFSRKARSSLAAMRSDQSTPGRCQDGSSNLKEICTRARYART
jgi:hypothetical protein